MKKTVLLCTVLMLALATGNAFGQSFLKRLGKAAKNAAENAIERKVEQKSEETVDKAFDKETYKKSEKEEKTAEPENNSRPQSPPPNNKQLATEMAYAKSDFVPGDVIIFEDNVVGEPLGEFPSRWDLLEGTVEVVSVNGETVIQLSEDGHIAPLMKNEKAYLSDEFTVEFDFWVNNQEEQTQAYYLNFWDGDDSNTLRFEIWDTDYAWNYLTPAGDSREGVAKDVPYRKNAWNHFALSFNKRAMKAYLNGTRYANVPNMAKPTRLTLNVSNHSHHRCIVKNVRIAQGAVPLYERMMTDGKIITYAITFDVGKALIRPESLTEINRIAKLMNDNPSLNFSVEGHTDNTGNAAANQTLSEARSKAIVNKLVQLGIAANRLTPVGKGQNTPIADNSTNEGRAKNRRVEFVKQ